MSSRASQAHRVWGKYRGTVLSPLDPLGQGRITALVPEVLGEVPCGWATPCTPYAGTTSGFYSIPPPGAGVWIEFEGGDVSRPIWVGCYWGSAEAPNIPPLVPPAPTPPTSKVWRSETGLTVALDDMLQTISITDGTSLNGVTIELAGATTTVKGARVVLNGQLVQEGSQAAAHPAVLGDALVAYLQTLTTLFNTHMHPGEMAGGFLPVTPAPPVPPMPPPAPALLSRKILLE